MGDVNQNIRVRVNAVLDGLPVFQQFSAVLDKIKSSSDAKIQVGDAASIANTNQLVTAVDALSKKIDSLKPSKLAELSTLIQGFAAGSTFLKNLGVDLETVKNGLSFVKDKAGELIEGVVSRAGPIIESVTTKVTGLVAALPLVGEGGAEAALGITAIVGAGALAVTGIGALIAILAAAGAAFSAIAAAAAAFIPYLVSMALRIAETDAAAGKLENRLRGGEIQGIIQDIKTKISDLTDELARALIPAILELLRVALDVVNQLTPVVAPFFSWVITQLENIGRGLVYVAIRAIAAGKAVAAAIAIGYATGSPIEAGKAAVSTYNASVDELTKAATTAIPIGGANGISPKTGGGGGGGAARPPKAEDTSQSQFALERAVAEARYKQISESLDRENQLITEKYDERKVTIADYYAEVLRIEDEKLEAEELRLLKELNAQQFQLKNALNKIDEDRASGAIKSDVEADAKKTNEVNKALEHSVQLTSDINSLRQKRAQLPHDIEQKEKADTDKLNESLQRQYDALDRLRGKGPLVEVAQQIGEIDSLLEEFADNPGMVAFLEEWREVVGTIAQADAALTRFQKAQELREATIATLQEQGSRNILSQFINAEKIRRIRQQELKDLQQVLKLQEAIAKRTDDPKAQEEVAIRIQKTRTQIVQLTNETKSFGDTLKDTFIDSLGNGLTNFVSSIGDLITGTKTLGQAFRDMALSIVQDLEQIIAKMLIMVILKKLLGSFAGGGSGASVLGGAGSVGDILGGSATGDYFPAAPGGRIIRVAEGGHDEVVLTTDPKHRNRTRNLLNAFLSRTGLLQGFDLGGWISAMASPQFEIPAYASGDWIQAPASAGAGAPSFNMGGVHFHGVKDYRSFKLNQAGMERDLSRAARNGMDRFRKG